MIPRATVQARREELLTALALAWVPLRAAARVYGVTPKTIRRDIAALARQVRLEARRADVVMHGGRRRRGCTVIASAAWRVRHA
jgi:DeoR/GlpR family transcriptional regulator of sugar metabolism